MICNQRLDATQESEVNCLFCRHSVEVRGMSDVVCLAYLAIKRPETFCEPCADFEGGKQPLSVLRSVVR